MTGLQTSNLTSTEARALAAYETAVSALTPLPRAAYLMCLVDDLSYGEIAARLVIDAELMEECMAHAIAVIACLIDGQIPELETPAPIVEAEAALLRRYRSYYAVVIDELDFRGQEPSGSVPAAADRKGIRSRTARIGSRPRTRPVVRSAKSFYEWLRTLCPFPDRRACQ